MSRAIILILLIKFYSLSVTYALDEKISERFPIDFIQKSFPNRLTETCFSDFDFFINRLEVKENWALKILETWGDLPPLSFNVGGRNADFGDFDACLHEKFPTNARNETESLGAQYVLATVKVRDTSYHWGICLPGSCSLDQLNELVEKITPEFGMNFSGIYGYQRLKDYEIWTPVQRWAIIFLILTLILKILSTSYEQKIGNSKLLTAFSLYRNGKYLIEGRGDTSLGFFDGARVFAMIGVVFHHTFIRIVDVANMNAYNSFNGFISKLLLIVCSQGWSSVDVFLFITGFLIATQFFSARKKGIPFNLLKFYLQRIVRLYPILFTLLLIRFAFFPYIGVSIKPNMNCMFDSFVQIWESNWYVTADISLYAVSPLILFSLHRYGYRFFPVMALSLFLMFLLHPPMLSEYTCIVRFHPWLLGVMLGYVMQHHQKLCWNISRGQNLLAWPVVLLLIWVQGISQDFHTDTFWIILLRRIISPVVLFWVTYLLLENSFPRVCKFLSLPVFQFLCKSSFAVYIVHFEVLEVLRNYYHDTPDINNFQAIQKLLTTLVLSIITAIPCALMFEFPYINVYKAISSRF